MTELKELNDSFIELQEQVRIVTLKLEAHSIMLDEFLKEHTFLRKG